MAQYDFRIDDSWQRQIDRSRELERQRLEIPRQEETERRLQELERQRIAKQKQVGAIMTTTTRPFFSERKRIIELAIKYRLPTIYSEKAYVDDGGLMSYGADDTDLFRRAAVYVDKILKRAKPGDLPVQQATKFEFVLNLKAAKQVGLTIPVRVLERANQVIK